MEISQAAKDMLQELINTGIGKAAASFSEMLEQEIRLTVPTLLILNLTELKTYLQSLPQQEYVNVTQPFEGSMQGQGIVSFPLEGGRTLINTLLENPDSDTIEFDVSEREVLAEVGNLIINAVGSTIGNMANVEIQYEIPEVNVNHSMIELDQESDDRIYCVGQGFFSVQGIDVVGTIMFIYSYENIEMLIQQLIPQKDEKVFKVLLVDDSLLIRQTVKRHLKANTSLDLVILEATTGLEALAVFDHQTPDLLIMDLLMPKMGGEEVLQELQSREHSCFIVTLSSNFQRPVRERVSTLGAHLFIEKPITPEKIATILEYYQQAQQSE